MKPNLSEIPIAVDRLATSDEIRAAMVPFPGPIEDFYAEILCEIATDLGEYVRIPAVELEIVSLMEELTDGQDTRVN